MQRGASVGPSGGTLVTSVEAPVRCPERHRSTRRGPDTDVTPQGCVVSEVLHPGLGDSRAVAVSRRPLLRHGYWHLVASMTRQQLRARYHQNSLHLAWTVIQPLALAGVYALFFKGILQVDGKQFDYLSYIVTGFFAWRMFASSMGAVSAISDSVQLISKVYFPREVIPLVNTATAFVDLAIGTVLMFAIVWIQWRPPSIHLAALPLAYLVLALFTAGATTLFTTLAVFLRDVAQAMPFILQAGFFATPIFYSAERVPSWLHWMLRINPIAVVIDAIRAIMLEHAWPNWALLGAHTVGAAAFFVLSVAYLRSVEHRMVDLA